jgi:hypothetical protein
MSRLFAIEKVDTSSGNPIRFGDAVVIRLQGGGWYLRHYKGRAYLDTARAQATPLIVAAPPPSTIGNPLLPGTPFWLRTQADNKFMLRTSIWVGFGSDGQFPGNLDLSARRPNGASGQLVHNDVIELGGAGIPDLTTIGSMLSWDVGGDEDGEFNSFGGWNFKICSTQASMLRFVAYPITDPPTIARPFYAWHAGMDPYVICPGYVVFHQGRILAGVLNAERRQTNVCVRFGGRDCRWMTFDGPSEAWEGTKSDSDNRCAC